VTKKNDEEKKVIKMKTKIQKAKKSISISGPGVKFSVTKGKEIEVSKLSSYLKESLINNGIINKE
jgi:hypothetical protein